MKLKCTENVQEGIVFSTAITIVDLYSPRRKQKEITQTDQMTFWVNVDLFVFQYMGATQSGQSGVLAVCPVVSGLRRG